MGELILDRKERGVNFVLCEDCHWIASLPDITRRGITSCPSCFKRKFAFITISSNEEYRYNLSRAESLEMSFSFRRGESKNLGADDVRASEGQYLRQTGEDKP